MRKSARKDDGDIAGAKRLGRRTKITPKTKDRVRHLAMNQLTGIRSVVKKLNFSEDSEALNKKAGMTKVRWYVKSSDWGKIIRAHTAKKKSRKPLLVLLINVIKTVAEV